MVKDEVKSFGDLLDLDLPEDTPLEDGEDPYADESDSDVASPELEESKEESKDESKDEPEPEKESEEEPEEESEEEEEEPKEDEEDLEQQLIAALSDMMAPPAPPASKDPETPEKPKVPDVPLEFFKDEEDLERGFSSVPDANKTMTRLTNRVAEMILQGVPLIVNASLERQRRMGALAEAFYQKNQDLALIKPVVGFAYRRLESQNPPTNEDEIKALMEQAGGEARKLVALIRKKQQQEKKTSKGGFLPTKQASRKTKGSGPIKRTAKEREQDEITEVLTLGRTS